MLQSYLTLYDPMYCCPPGSSVHGDSPGKNTGVGWHALLHGIFLTQGSNPRLLHCRLILYPLSHQGGPNIYVFTLKLKKKPPKPKNNHHVTLPPYNLQAGTLRRHSVFRLWLFALPASATDPLPGLCNSNLTAWFRTRLWIYVTPPSPLVPHAWPDLLNQCPRPIHSINKTQQNHTYVCKLRSLNHW